MSDLIEFAIQELPNIIGFVVLAWIMFRQNNRLLDDVLERIEFLEHQVNDLKVLIASRKMREE